MTHAEFKKLVQDKINKGDEPKGVDAFRMELIIALQLISDELLEITNKWTTKIETTDQPTTMIPPILLIEELSAPCSPSKQV